MRLTRYASLSPFRLVGQTRLRYVVSRAPSVSSFAVRESALYAPLSSWISVSFAQRTASLR